MLSTVKAVAVAASVLLSTPQSSTTSPPQPRAVATVKEVMQTFVVPASDRLFEAVAIEITAQGTEEKRAPTTDRQWAALRTNALTLAESGNLLMMAGRTRDGQDWMRMAQTLVDTSRRALEATQGKDAEALASAGDEIYLACDTCHRKYKPRVTSLP